MSIADEVPASPASPARPRAEVLRRADGIELIGEFEDSGFKEPPHIARRADGQVVQLTDLLYAIADAADGRRDVHDIAAIVGEQSGRPVNGDNVALLAERQLRPMGVLALPDGSTPELEKREALMSLRHRRPLLSERTVNAGARLFTWLHWPPVTIAVLLAVLAFDAWLFFLHGIAGGMRAAIYDPALLLLVLASVVVATAFHEFGHASACRYGGARPGVMGVGLYLVYPAFYCDVTDAYRLNRAGRLRTDLGGVYFNAIFALLAGGVFFVTGEEAALLAAFLQHVIMFQQLLPLLRFDGYYVMTDMTGVPDILSRIKPIFRSLVRGKRREPKVMELKPWVRVVVTAYLVTLIPTLFFLFTWMVMGAPRLIATVHDSLGLQFDRIRDAAGPAEMGVGAVRTTALVLPVASMSLSLSRASRALGRVLTRWSQDSIVRKAVAGLGVATLVGAIGYVWWPNGDYEPIRPGERGTIGEVVSAIPDTPGGRPFFTPEREAAFGTVPTEREAEAARRARERGEVPAGENGDPNATQGVRSAPADGRVRSDGAALLDSIGLGEDDPAPLSDESSPYGSHSTSDGSGGWESGSSGTTSGQGTGTTTQPAPSGTTQPAPGTTSTEPAPSEPAPTTTEPAPSEPAPTTTESSPTTTETAPSTTESAPTESSPLATPTAPDSTSTTPELDAPATTP